MSDAELMQEVEARIGELERLPDARAQELARQAMCAVLALHKEALARLLRALAERGALGVALTEFLGRDALVGSVLALHGLHPRDVRARIDGAIDAVRPLVALNGARLAVAGEGGEVEITLHRGSGCPSTGAHLRRALEEALDRAAPDAKGCRVVEAAE